MLQNRPAGAQGPDAEPSWRQGRPVELMIDILDKIFPFFAIILAGYAARGWRFIDDNGVRGISRFVMFLALPALLFSKLAGSSAETVLSLRFLLGYAGAALLAFGACAYIARLAFGRDFSQSALIGLAGTYGNIGFLGIPLLSALAGSWIAVPLALVLTVDLVLLVPLASVLMRLGRAGGRNRAGIESALIAAIVKNPLVIAIAAGALFSLAGHRLPGPVDKLTLILSQAAAPCAMFVVGAALATARAASHPAEAIFISLYKLAAYPAIVWGILGFAGIDGDWRVAATLGAAMPAAAVLSVIAGEHDIQSGQVSMAVLISTILSLFTLSLAMTIL